MKFAFNGGAVVARPENLKSHFCWSSYVSRSRFREELAETFRLLRFRVDQQIARSDSELVFPIRYIPIPEYWYSGLQIPIPIPAKISRYLPVLRTYKNGHF
jgi:hypothetical protein